MKKIGIIIAQQEEANPLLERISELSERGELFSVPVLVALSGVGKLNAMDTAYNLVLQHNVDILLNIGVSAGRGDLDIGELVLVNQVYDGDFDISVFNHPKYYVPEVGDYIDTSIDDPNDHIRTLPCFTISKFLEGDIDTDIKDYVVDMEYYGIAYAGKKLGIPTYSLKAISDNNKDTACSDYEKNLDMCSKKLADYIIEHLVRYSSIPN